MLTMMACRPAATISLLPTRPATHGNKEACLAAGHNRFSWVLTGSTSRKHGAGMCIAMATGSPGGNDPGGNVIDKPTTLPGIDLTKEAKRKRPPMYKVLLHNDDSNRREYVVKVLLKIVDGLTVDDAVNVMQEAHLYGLALVIACAMADAERYTNGLRSNGLVATMEPDA